MNKEKLLEMLNELQPGMDFESSDNFVADGLLDSFDIVQLVSDIEAECNISISALDILPENFQSIDAILTLIKNSN